MNALERFLLAHYLRMSRRGLVAFLATFAFLGITVGVTAMLLVSGVMEGFQREIRSRILGAQPHLTIDRFFQEPFVLNDTLSTIIQQKVPHLRAWGPYVLMQALAQHDRATQGVLVKGVDPHHMIHRDFFEQFMEEGEMAPEKGLVLGNVLASNLQVVAGDTVILYALESSQPTPLGRIFRRVPLKVVGVFDAGLYDINSTYALTDIAFLQKLLGLGNKIHGIDLTLKDPMEASTVKEQLRHEISYPYRISTWQEWNRTLFSALKLEKIAMFLILSLVTLVASFTMLSTLMLLVMQRTREIAVLLTMGVEPTAIERVFIGVGLGIGLAGMGVGSLLSAGIAWLQNTFYLYRLPPDVYFIDTLTIQIGWMDVLGAWGIALGVALMASYYPARRAARMSVVEALREG